jgi:Transglycosylase SLT domain
MPLISSLNSRMKSKSVGLFCLLSVALIGGLLWTVTIYADSHIDYLGLVGTKEKPTFDGGAIHEGDTLPHKENLRDQFNHSFKRITSLNLPEKIIANAIKKGYLPFILTKLNELHLPATLALIPVIESGYDAQAVSPKGAAGLWQIMPGTATHLGITSIERFELAASTCAALHYLQALHRQFGSWELAVAAYNAGSVRVQKALTITPHCSFQKLALPHETKRYVAHFIALQQTFENDLF